MSQHPLYCVVFISFLKCINSYKSQMVSSINFTEYVIKSCSSTFLCQYICIYLHHSLLIVQHNLNSPFFHITSYNMIRHINIHYSLTWRCIDSQIITSNNINSIHQYRFKPPLVVKNPITCFGNKISVQTSNRLTILLVIHRVTKSPLSLTNTKFSVNHLQYTFSVCYHCRLVVNCQIYKELCQRPPSLAEHWLIYLDPLQIKLPVSWAWQHPMGVGFAV